MSDDLIYTNIFIYLFDESVPEKQLTAEQIVHDAIKKKRSAISF